MEQHKAEALEKQAELDKHKAKAESLANQVQQEREVASVPHHLAAVGRSLVQHSLCAACRRDQV